MWKGLIIPRVPKPWQKYKHVQLQRKMELELEMKASTQWRKWKIIRPPISHTFLLNSFLWSVGKTEKSLTLSLLIPSFRDLQIKARAYTVGKNVAQNHWTENYEIKCSLLTAATISGNWEIAGIWNSIKKLLSCEGWYLHNLLERSEQQEASFDVSGGCQITALLKTAHCDALTSGDFLKWLVWLKVVNSKREVHSWVAIRISSKKTPITRLLVMKEKPTLIFSGTIESKIRDAILQ